MLVPLSPAGNMNPVWQSIAIVIMFSGCMQIYLSDIYLSFHIVATQGLLREGEDHLTRYFEDYIDQGSYPINTPMSPVDDDTPKDSPKDEPMKRRVCYPACRGSAKYCHGRCVYFGRSCVGGHCARSPYFWLNMWEAKNLLGILILWKYKMSNKFSSAFIPSVVQTVAPYGWVVWKTRYIKIQNVSSPYSSFLTLLWLRKIKLSNLEVNVFRNNFMLRFHNF